MKFRPSIITSWGSWQVLEGEWDGQVLWVAGPAGTGRRGIHLTTRTEIEPLEPVASVPKPVDLRAQVNNNHQQAGRRG
jgi:hypothetical protein